MIEKTRFTHSKENRKVDVKMKKGQKFVFHSILKPFAYNQETQNFLFFIGKIQLVKSHTHTHTHKYIYIYIHTWRFVGSVIPTLSPRPVFTKLLFNSVFLIFKYKLYLLNKMGLFSSFLINHRVLTT